METKWQPKETRMASNGSNMVSKRVFEKGMKKRSEKGHASRYGPIPCGPLKELPEWGIRDRLSSLETLHWCPEGTVADILNSSQWVAFWGSIMARCIVMKAVAGGVHRRSHLRDDIPVGTLGHAFCLTNV